MIRKIQFTAFSAILIAILPLVSLGQQAEYFPNRLIIKYESDQKLQQIQSKIGVKPQTAVQQFLTQNGARSTKPLLSRKLQQAIRQRNLPSTDDVLRIREVTFTGNINPVQLAAKISSMPGVEYAEPKYIRRMSVTPNDPELGKYVETHNFADAWNLSQGASDVTIAIVDGGVGFEHPDLNDDLWVNQDEVPPTLQPQVDQNSDGTITSAEIQRYLEDNNADHNSDGNIALADALHDDSSFMDGVDTDNNNFTDDLFGWDFWASGGVDNPISTDNNPIHDGTDHGTHVAGIAAAETNNDTDIAGAGYNSKYMAVKVGGIPDNPSTDIDESRAIGFGFEGIAYAANEGADIINCSFGGGSPSEAERDIIEMATNMGALVVAAAGNDFTNQISYPGGYDRVLSVGSVETSGSIASYSNYGYNLDVLATGTSILSTSYNGNLVEKTGTSMATPVVSGLASLVKETHPGWSAERIGMQIRASASYIYDINDDTYSNRLGHGSIDAFRALDTNLPGIKVISYRFVNENGEKLAVDEPGTVEITLTNVGNNTSGLSLQLESLNEGGIQLSNPNQQLGSVATGDILDVAFDITISRDFDLTSFPTLRLNFVDSNQNYDDFSVLEYEKLLYDIVAANNVKTSFGADGTVGFTNPLTGRGGVGFIPRTPTGSGGYQEGNNMLFEGGLMIQINGELFDAVRAPEGLSRDFFPEQVFTSTTNNNGSVTGTARFVTETDSARQAAINLKTYAFEDPAISNVVFLEYTIQNPSSFYVMKNVYAGLFNDWDIGSNSSNNSTSFSESDSVLYVSDASSNSTQPLAAVAHLGPISGALAIDNAFEGQADSLTFGIYDGFLDAEKKQSLTSGTVRTEIQNTDVSAVVASGPYTLNPGAEVTVGFVYAFGDDQSELLSQIREARSRNLFEVSPTGRALSEEVPEQTKLFQNYPNPFESSTQIRIDLEQSTEVKLTIFNVLGRKVRTLANREFEAGSHYISFTPETLSSGVYFARLITEQGQQTIPLTLIK